MIVEKLVEKLPLKSTFTRMIVGGLFTAFMISIGTLGILRLFNFSMNPAIVAAFAAMGAALYAAKVRK